MELSVVTIQIQLLLGVEFYSLLIFHVNTANSERFSAHIFLKGPLENRRFSEEKHGSPPVTRPETCRETFQQNLHSGYPLNPCEQ